MVARSIVKKSLNRPSSLRGPVGPVAISGPWGAVEWAFQKHSIRDCFVRTYVLPRNDEHGGQPSVGKPRNEIASSCLTALLAMTEREVITHVLSLRGPERARGNLW